MPAMAAVGGGRTSHPAKAPAFSTRGVGGACSIRPRHPAPNVGRRGRRALAVSSQLQIPRPREAGAPPPGEEAAAAALDAPAGAEATADSCVPIPHLWDALTAAHGEAVALLDPHASPPQQYTYAGLAVEVRTAAAGLASLGLRHGDALSLFSENSPRWLAADQAVMAAGGAAAVRGVSSTDGELRYILEHSQSVGLVAQDAATLDRLLGALAPSGGGGGGVYSPLASTVRFVVVLWGEPSAAAAAALACPAVSWEGLLARGREALAAGAFTPPRICPDDLATLVYTSGTTGHPKGVALTHANLAYQVANFGHFIDVRPGDRTLSLLPPWHIYERTAGYYVLSRGAAQVYSSIRHFRDDLGAHPPDYFVCVPLVLDTLHSKVLATLKKASAVRRALATGLLAAAAAYVSARRVVEGTALRYAVAPRPLTALLAAWLRMTLLAPLNWLAQRLVVAKVRAALGVKKCVVSGGGSLAPHLDDFFESIGLPVINGWGLTETSPVLACRRNFPGQNVRGSVGVPIPGTEIRVVHPETRADLPDGEPGLILARGPGVMRGYHNDGAATAAAFVAGGGWFDTGDLGWRAPAGVAGSAMAGSVVLSGRAKDTIVLTSGENVEPQPLEDAICVSPYIKQAVVVGQGRRALGALLVPNDEALAELAAQRAQQGGPPASEGGEAPAAAAALPRAEVEALLWREVTAALSTRIRWEHVASIEVLSRPFSVEDGTLTRTMKPRRPAIMERYAAQVSALERRLR